MSKSDPTGLACQAPAGGSCEDITVKAPKLALILPGGAVVTHGREYTRAIDAYRHPNSAAARHFSSMGISFKAAGMSTPSADDDSDDYPDIGSANGLQRSFLPPGGMGAVLSDFERLFGVGFAATMLVPEGGIASKLIAPSSRALGRALEAAGIVRPAESAAHHIVAGSAQGAALARTTLQNLGIGINDAANGVFLKGVDHAGVHTAEYYDAVNKALSGVTTKAEAEQVLKSIGQKLQAGTYP